jgi:hypothetical protein
MIPGLDATASAHEIGVGGIDNIVTNAERICTNESQRITLTNESVLVGLQAQYKLLQDEERHLEERLRWAPPAGELRRLRLRAIYYWALAVLLAVAAFVFAVLTFDPFRLGWKSWLYCGGIAALTPFLVEKLLDSPRMERTVKVLTAAATIASLAGLMLLAVIRGDLLAHEIQANSEPPVVLDDAAPQQHPSSDTFYDSTLHLLRLALLLFAFAMELGAGLALHEAWRTAPNDAEDWKKLRAELVQVRQGMAVIAREATMLRNEPAIFAARFWRDFYRGLITNAVRNAMTKLLLLAVAVALCGPTVSRAQEEASLNLVVAIDLSRSVASVGPDGKSEFQKNVDGVAQVLSEVPAGARVTIIGITDHSFTQPYIILRAHVPEGGGYFGERLDSARRQLAVAWKVRSAKLIPQFSETDIFGALALAQQIFSTEPEDKEQELFIFSDMRESTKELDLEALDSVPSFSALAPRCGILPDLRRSEVYVIGADGAGKPMAYWQSLQAFWSGYFDRTGAALREYSALRERVPR